MKKDDILITDFLTHWNFLSLKACFWCDQRPKTKWYCYFARVIFLGQTCQELEKIIHEEAYIQQYDQFQKRHNRQEELFVQVCTCLQ